jgi:predicted RNA methylase
MNSINRLARELAGLGRMLSFWTMARYITRMGLSLPSVLTSRSLTPVDRKMSGTVVMSYKGVKITVPLDEVDRLTGADDSPAFSGIREMFASDVYMRAFRDSVPMSTVIDLGANRGMFSLLALTAYRAKISVGVEPSPRYVPVAQLLCTANNIEPTRMPRHIALVSTEDHAESVTLDKVMAMHQLTTVDFLKCDIEGAEFDVLLNAGDVLAKVNNIAMELHHDAGDATVIAQCLQDRGFKVRTTDQFGGASPIGSAHYLYASRTGDLAV